MRVVLGRLAAALILLLAGGYLLQMDDSAGRTVVGSPPVSLAPVVLPAYADTGGREYFVSRGHEQVVPYGFRTLTFPILMYHYIRQPPSPRIDLVGYNLSISPADFAAQMGYLATHGYHPVTFNDIRAYWARTKMLPAKPVVITLDDGYQDLYTAAFPVLQAYRFTAVAYIVSGFVGRPGYATANEILEMDHYGIEIAAHTVDHANLQRAPYASLMYELVQSKRSLEQLVGHPVIDMAYPSGKFNATVVAAVELAGYYSATTEQFSYWHSPQERYFWARVRVFGGEKLVTFAAYLGPTMPSIGVTNVTVDVETITADGGLQTQPGD